MQKGSLIVTGGFSGIGKAVLDKISGRFYKKNVCNIDVRAKPPIDVRDYEAISSVMKRVIVRGETNYLFSAAGVIFLTDPETGRAADFSKAPIDQLRAMVEINFMGTINVLHAFISELNRKKASGNVIVVSSISSFYSGGPNMAVYDATKAAISALAKRLVPYKNIRINIIYPGSVRTNIGSWKQDFSEDVAGRQIVKQGQDADEKRLGKQVLICQIAEFVEYLFFRNHGMDGADIVIDEGLTLMGRENY